MKHNRPQPAAPMIPTGLRMGIQRDTNDHNDLIDLAW